MAKPKKPGTAVMKWEEELAQAAKKQSAAPKSSGSERTFISFKGGVMTIGDNKIKDGKIDAVILDFAYVNAYYDKPFNPKQPASPACFAISRETTTLAPHEDAPDKQDAKCAGCPQNEFGSRGDGGNGKACKNNIRLTLIAAGDLEKDLDKAQIVYAMVPATSLKAFAGFYKSECCDESGDPSKPTYAFITTVSVTPDPQVQFRLSFEKGDNVEREQFYALRKKVEELGDDVLFPFPKAEDMPQRTQAPAKKRKF